MKRTHTHKHIDDQMLHAHRIGWTATNNGKSIIIFTRNVLLFSFPFYFTLNFDLYIYFIIYGMYCVQMWLVVSFFMLSLFIGVFRLLTIFHSPRIRRVYMTLDKRKTNMYGVCIWVSFLRLLISKNRHTQRNISIYVLWNRIAATLPPTFLSFFAAHSQTHTSLTHNNNL